MSNMQPPPPEKDSRPLQYSSTIHSDCKVYIANKDNFKPMKDKILTLLNLIKIFVNF